MAEARTSQRYRLVLAAALVLCAPSSGQAQLLGRAREKAKERVERKTEEAIERGLDKIEGAVDCVVGDTECLSTAKEEGKQVRMVDARGTPAGAAARPATVKPAGQPQGSGADARAVVSGTPGEAARPGEGAWANYDFVPGDRVLFSDDFASDRIGNFPRRLELRAGNIELVEVMGKRWLRITDPQAAVAVPLPEVLPQRFTMEFDITMPANWCSAIFFSEKAAASGDCKSDDGFVALSVEAGSGTMLGLMTGDTFVAKREVSDLLGEYDRGVGIIGLPLHVRVHVDGAYAKVYAGQVRVANVPSITITRGKKIVLALNGGDSDHPILLAGLSVNAGGRALYDALVADGRVATQGIYFDVNADRLRPESTPVLKQIGEMLRDHPDLQLQIQGHTDNAGQAGANQSLSERRAAAVKAFLITAYSIAESRLSSKGFGDTTPVAPNTTPEGRQQNRRVELVKM